MRLYLVRHGQTDMNKNNMFYGWTDADINDTGLFQATQLAEYFKDVPLDAIYSSDLLRASHTAQIIAQQKDMQVEKRKEFRELYYGDWENQPAVYVENHYKEELRGWATNWLDRTIPNGESFQGFYKRVTEGVDTLIKESKGKQVMLVAHNGALSAILCHLTGAGGQSFWRFDSKQGHYTSVLISEKHTTIETINQNLFRGSC